MKTIVFVIIVFLFIGALVGLYYFYEKPLKDKNIEHFNTLNIKYNYPENYSIYVDNILYAEGQTLKDTFISIKVPANKSISLVGDFKNTSKYYSFKEDLSYLSNEIEKDVRIEKTLEEKGQLSYSYSTISNDTLRVNIMPSGLVKNLSVCIRWTVSIISVEIQNKTKIDKIRPHVDKCYDLNITLKDEGTYFVFKYKLFGTLKDSDDINFIFIDNDGVHEIQDSNNGILDSNYSLGKFK